MAHFRTQSLDRLTLAVCSSLPLLLAACSDGSRSPALHSVPTSSSAVSVAPAQNVTISIDAALRPFPGRENAFRFRTEDLEQRYREMGRSRFQTYVNPEGSVIWVGEYLRYRAGQCSHDDAFNRIRTQIGGGGVPAVCGQNEQPFPGRGDALTFRRQLESVYQSRGAGFADTVVDDEGDVIWTMEYYRYVLSGCSHAATIQKIADQIGGRGVPNDCTPVVQPLTGSFSVQNTPCVAPSTGNVSCRFVASGSGGQPPLTYSWRFTNPANNQVVNLAGEQVSPALGCNYAPGVPTFNVAVVLTIAPSIGNSITINGSRQIARADGACGT